MKIAQTAWEQVLRIEQKRWARESYDMAIGLIPRRFRPTMQQIKDEVASGLRLIVQL